MRLKMQKRRDIQATGCFGTKMLRKRKKKKRKGDCLRDANGDSDHVICNGDGDGDDTNALISWSVLKQ